jgi:hypothetical protein
MIAIHFCHFHHINIYHQTNVINVAVHFVSVKKTGKAKYFRVSTTCGHFPSVLI